jgi:hypothetical protein
MRIMDHAAYEDAGVLGANGSVAGGVGGADEVHGVDRVELGGALSRVRSLVDGL